MTSPKRSRTLRRESDQSQQAHPHLHRRASRLGRLLSDHSAARTSRRSSLPSGIASDNGLGYPPMRKILVFMDLHDLPRKSLSPWGLREKSCYQRAYALAPGGGLAGRQAAETRISLLLT